MVQKNNSMSKQQGSCEAPYRFGLIKQQDKPYFSCDEIAKENDVPIWIWNGEQLR
jgi:hypothetical protein